MTPADVLVLVLGFGALLVIPAAIMEAAARRSPRVARAIDRIVERIAR